MVVSVLKHTILVIFKNKKIENWFITSGDFKIMQD